MFHSIYLFVTTISQLGVLIQQPVRGQVEIVVHREIIADADELAAGHVPELVLEQLDAVVELQVGGVKHDHLVQGAQGQVVDRGDVEQIRQVPRN